MAQTDTMAQQQKLNAILYGQQKARNAVESGTFSNQGELLDWAYRDTEKLASTINSYSLFIGSSTFAAGGTKTAADRNFKLSQFPSNEKQLVQAIKFYYVSAALKNNASQQAVVDFLNGAVLRLAINGKDASIDLTLAELLGLNNGIISVPTVAGDNVDSHFTGVTAKAYPLNVPITLAAITQFEITIAGTAPSALLDGDKIRVALQGKLARLN